MRVVGLRVLLEPVRKIQAVSGEIVSIGVNSNRKYVKIGRRGGFETRPKNGCQSGFETQPTAGKQR